MASDAARPAQQGGAVGVVHVASVSYAASGGASCTAPSDAASDLFKKSANLVERFKKSYREYNANSHLHTSASIQLRTSSPQFPNNFDLM